MSQPTNLLDQSIHVDASASLDQNQPDPPEMPVSSNHSDLHTPPSGTQSNDNDQQTPKTKSKSKLTDSGTVVKKRTVRACDQCYIQRTKCDGEHPCFHCVSVKQKCEYARVPQKRGKASATYLKAKRNRELMLQKGLNDIPTFQNGTSEMFEKQDENNHMFKHEREQFSLELSSSSPVPQGQQLSFLVSQDHSLTNHIQKGASQSPQNLQTQQAHLNHQESTDHSTQPLIPQHNTLPPTSISQHYNQHIEQHANGQHPMNHQKTQPMDQFGSQADPMAPLSNTNASPPPISMGLDEIPLAWSQSQMQAVKAAQISPDYSDDKSSHQNVGLINLLPNSLTSISPEQITEAPVHPNIQSHRPFIRDDKYQVLHTIEHLVDLPLSLQQDLLEFYFSPSNSHVLAYLLRKSSVLPSEGRARKCSPSLVLSMLLVAAHDCDNTYISGLPSARSNLIKFFLEQTLAQLPPVTDATAPPALDDVITYIQLGTIMSASELKGSSIRWWNYAWALARELKLNCENPGLDRETREECRRTWWLLYCVDRHLALCYNRQLTISDAECANLSLPQDESVWMSAGPLPMHMPTNSSGIGYRVTGGGVFGYFLPIMSILGILVQIHHLELNPVIRSNSNNYFIIENLRNFAAQCLMNYSQSLSEWDNLSGHRHERHGSEVSDSSSNKSSVWIDYAWQLHHVMTILLSASWDPMELLNKHIDDIAINRSIQSAQSIQKILKSDPDLSFMPFFFGIYLLQGSLVLTAKAIQLEAATPHNISQAMETLVRAHEVCIVTMKTEYQRNMRKVMRFILTLVNCATPNEHVSNGKLEEHEEERRRHIDILSLYRWDAVGNGLAV